MELGQADQPFLPHFFSKSKGRCHVSETHMATNQLNLLD